MNVTSKKAVVRPFLFRIFSLIASTNLVAQELYAVWTLECRKLPSQYDRLAGFVSATD